MRSMTELHCGVFGVTEHLNPTTCVGRDSKLERPEPTFLQTTRRELLSVESPPPPR